MNLTKEEHLILIGALCGALTATLTKEDADALFAPYLDLLAKVHVEAEATFELHSVKDSDEKFMAAARSVVQKVLSHEVPA